MKVQWLIKGLDSLEEKHLAANVAYSMMDILLEARKTVKRIEENSILNSRLQNPKIRMLAEYAAARGDLLLNKTEEMLNWSLVKSPEGHMLTMFMGKEYFDSYETLREGSGRAGRMVIKMINRQEIIEKVEYDLRRVYGHPFTGAVLEDDGKHLTVSSMA